MTTLYNDIQAYREPLTRGVSVHRNPTNHSCDNALLFSATYVVQLGKQPDCTEAQYTAEFVWLCDLIKDCQLEPGLYNRYPHITGDFNSWDDLVGIACVDDSFAQIILAYGRRNCWMWDTEFPNRKSLLTKLASPNFPRSWLLRIPIFRPFLKAASGESLTLLDKLIVAGVYIANLTEPLNETSGKCLLFLCAEQLQGQGWLVNKAISKWQDHIKRHYGGIRGVYAIYFGAEHPLTIHAVD